MQGFDGDPLRLARLREALQRVVEVFPEHIEKPRCPTWFDPEDVVRNDRFDAIVRAHKKNRLELPVVALAQEGVAYHNFSLMHLRRLAWFVPSLLSTWANAGPGFPFGRFVPASITSILSETAIVEGEEWSWTPEETASLSSFFEAALLAALATPLEPPSAESRARLDAAARDFSGSTWLELGLELQVRAEGRALETVGLAQSMRVPVAPLVATWVRERTRLTDDHLLVAFARAREDERPPLAFESVAERLAQAFFASTGERAEAFSAAEKLVRAWI